METDLVKVFDRLERHFSDNRPVTVMVGNEVFLQNLQTKKWERVSELLLPGDRRREVSNAEALFDAVVEEARRRGNASGDNMTVIFTPAGGQFYTDDRNRQNMDVWGFLRKFSGPFLAFTEMIAQMEEEAVDHSGLLRAMSRLKFTVVDFAPLFGAMRRVRIDKKVSVNSQPQFEDGKSGAEVSLSLQIEGAQGGNAKARFPAEFVVELPVVSMSTRKYRLTVDVDVWVDNAAVRFALRCPELEAVKEQAILDEIAGFRDRVKKVLPDLLVVTDL